MVYLAEKRLSLRMSAAYPVRIRNRRGMLLTAGRTANISENGLFALVHNQVNLPDEVLVEVTLPSAASTGHRDAKRTVVYTAQVIRKQVLGNLMGVGIMLVEKLQ
jgi:hypothetical protein